MMNPIVVTVVQEIGKIVHAGVQKWANSPIKPDYSSLEEKPQSSRTQVIVSSRSNVALPNREETTNELKRRLAKELYKAELDLANGLMIAGKPCDCLSNKHTLELDACTEELISQDPDNNVYQEIQAWIPANQYKLTPEAILSGQYKQDYPHMALQFKEFRKRVLGSDARSSIIPQSVPATQVTVLKVEKPVVAEDHELTLEEAQEIAAEQAKAEVKRRWTALS